MVTKMFSQYMARYGKAQVRILVKPEAEPSERKKSSHPKKRGDGKKNQERTTPLMDRTLEGRIKPKRQKVNGHGPPKPPDSLVKVDMYNIKQSDTQVHPRCKVSVCACPIKV